MSLKNCIQSLQALLKDFDVEAVVEAAEEYQARGMDRQAAETQAVQDHLDELQRDRARIEKAIADAYAVESAAHEAATSPKNALPAPTDAQKEAGNYQKGHVRIAGLDISIENPAGSKRRPEWPALKSHYGYIKRTEGKDGDHVDVFIKPGTPESYDGPVFVVDQKKPGNGHFDEHKVLLGWDSLDAAREGYLENYTPGWDGIRDITQASQEDFALWLHSGYTKMPFAEFLGIIERDRARRAKRRGDDLATAPDAVTTGAPAKIVDVGEKVGGARKDTATPTGPRSAKAQEDGAEPGWRKRFQVTQITKSTREGEVGRWVIHDLRTKDFLGQPRQFGRDTYPTREAAEAMVPMAAVALKHRVRGTSRADGTVAYEIWRQTSDRKAVKVVDEVFATHDDAMRYMAEHAAEIVETKTSFGEEILPRPETVTRTGPARRTGNVTGDDLRETFGFRAVEFGEWNAQDERQTVMNHAYDALMDLAEIMGVPPKALGLNGELALAFGARGHGLSGARAHYERDYGIINLTKMSGAGSLGHEWFHALDHYFARQDGKSGRERVRNERGDLVYPAESGERDFASHGFQRSGSEVRPEVRAAYTALIETMFAKAEQYVEDTQKAERFVGETRNDLAKKLQAMRTDLAEQKDPRYWKRKNQPASAEQLAHFDTLAEKLISGEALDVEMRRDEKARSKFGGFRQSNDVLDQISAIYKAVRGRSGFDTTNRSGRMDDIASAMRRYKTRLEVLASAKQGESKTKRVPTSFQMEAKSIDQGRASEYWATPHEMAARAFSAYLEDRMADRGFQGDFLTYGTNFVVPTPWGWRRPFPEGAERKAINEAFDKFVSTLETRETERGVEIREEGGDYAVPTETAEFKRWFEGSKVVDENGRPLVLYHGSRANFSTFRKGSNGLIYASPDPTYAATFAGTTEYAEGQNIVPVYMRASTLLDLRSLGAGEASALRISEALEKAGVSIPEGVALLEDPYGEAPVYRVLLDGRLTRAIKEAGYDGIVLREAAWTSGGEVLEADAYAVFDASHVKSAIGNRGTFDPADPSIVRENRGDDDYTVSGKRNTYGIDPRQLDLFAPAQRDAHLAARKAVVSLGRGAPTVLGSRIAADFREQGRVDLIGQEVHSPADLAVLAQVYRDPRFETLRYIFTNAEDRVVYQTGVTSRLPGAAFAMPMSAREARNAAAVQDRLVQILKDGKSAGGTQLWLLHNHPSGISAPSDADRFLTVRMGMEAMALDIKLQPHVIINHNEYSTISLDHKGSATLRTEPLEAPKTYDLGVPRIPHRLLGRKINGPADVVALGKEMEADPDTVVIIGRGGREGAVGLVATANAGDLDSARAAITLRRLAIANGVQELFAVNVPARLEKAVKRAMEIGLILDAVDQDGASYMERGQGGGARGGFALGRRQFAVRVESGSAPYDPTGREPFRLDVIDTAGGPMFVNDEITLFPGGEHPLTGQWGDDGAGFTIVDTQTGANLGVVILGLSGKRVTDLYWIESAQAGAGRKTVRALAATADQPIQIRSIIPSAIGFWDKMGASRRDENNDAPLTWGAFEEAARHARMGAGATGEPQAGAAGDAGPSGRVEEAQAGYTADTGDVGGNRALREQDRSLRQKAKQWFRRQFAPGGLLPEAVFREKIARDNELQVVEFDIRHLVGRLERVVQSAYGMPFDQLNDGQQEALQRGLAGELDGVPEAIRPALASMRRYIDRLSVDYVQILRAQTEELLASGQDAAALAKAELMQTIMGNIGEYVHRSYRAFDDPKWFQKIPDDTLNAARAYLRNRYLQAGEPADRAARMAEATLNEIVKNGTAYDSMEAFIKESKLGAKDLSVLKQRKRIAPEIRALLGEYTDPRVNFAKSATKMGRLIWNQHFLDAVREIGLGVFLFEGADRPATATSPIAAEASEVYAPLNGLWTFPEINQAFKDALGRENLGDIYRVVVRLNGLVKYGKAQPLDAEIKTPRGPITMGEVEVGTIVCGINGQTTVTGVFPQGERDIYKFTFNDGSATEASDEHLWEVEVFGAGTRKMTTNEILNLPAYRIAMRQVAIPLGVAHYEAQAVPLDPYLLGVLIGDGSFRHMLRLTCADQEILERVRTLLPEGYVLHSPPSWAEIDYCIKAPNITEGRKHQIKAHLKAMGLWGHTSLTKFIPDAYLRNSIEVRMDLMRGLLDTDGWVDRKGQPRFGTSSRKLAEDVRELAESLGASVRTCEKESASGNTAYDLCIRVPDAREWFWLPRKKEKATVRIKPAKRTIASIEYVGKKECQCIMVDDPRHLYLTDRFIVTHNTVLSPTTAARNWQSAMFFALANGHFNLLEMRRSLGALREYFTQQGEGETLAYLRKLKQLGVVYDTPYAGEMMRLMRDARLEELLSSNSGKALRAFEKGNQYARDFYSFGDDFWKIVGFENEKRALILAGLAPAAAEREAAERIRNTYPTYSMVGRGVQSLARNPFIGTFVSFPAEIIRTTGNMLRYIARDLRSSNPRMRALGLKRAVGMALVAGGFHAVSALSRAWLGMDDDDEEAVRELAAPWQKNSTFLFVGRDEDGHLRYFDLSFLDPYGYWKRPVTAMLRGQPWEDAAASVLKEMLVPFLGTDIAAGAIIEIIANKKSTGGPVYNDEGPVQDQVAAIADHLRRAVQPGIVSNIERATKAMAGERQGSGRVYSKEDEALALVGWRASTLDPRTSLYYRTFEFEDQKQGAMKSLTDVLRDVNPVSDDEIASAHAAALAEFEDAYRAMQKAVQAARMGGMTDAQMGEIMKLSGIGREDIAILLGRQPPVMRISERSMINAVKKVRSLFGEEAAKIVLQRYRRAAAMSRRRAG